MYVCLWPVTSWIWGVTEMRQTKVGLSGSNVVKKQLIIRVIHTIIDATKEWAKSRNTRRPHLRSVMMIEGRLKGSTRIAAG